MLGVRCGACWRSPQRRSVQRGARPRRRRSRSAARTTTPRPRRAASVAQSAAAARSSSHRLTTTRSSQRLSSLEAQHSPRSCIPTDINTNRRVTKKNKKRRRAECKQIVQSEDAPEKGGEGADIDGDDGLEGVDEHDAVYRDARPACRTAMLREHERLHRTHLACDAREYRGAQDTRRCGVQRRQHRACRRPCGLVCVS